MKKVSKEQPETFTFTKENLDLAKGFLSKYPKEKKASAVMPILYLAQKQNNNWIPLAAIKFISNFLNMSYIKVYEVATFYSMYNLSQVGKYFVQVCTTTPCLIRGSDKIVDSCKRNISKNENELSKNKLCSWMEVECLGACVNAPMIQINNDYYEDLNESKADEIFKNLLNDEKPKNGSFKNRKNSAPEKGRLTLKEFIDA